MKKLIEKLAKENFDFNLGNYTRDLLFFHIRDIIRDIKRIKKK